MKTFFIIVLLFMSGILHAQIRPTDCELYKLANYKNGITDTIVIKARYHSIAKSGEDAFPELDELDKQGVLKKKDYEAAIVLWVTGCKEIYVPHFTTGWYPDYRFNTKKYHGKEYNFTCVFYKGVSDRKNRKYQFFTVLKME